MENFEEQNLDLLSSGPLEVDEDSGYLLREAGTWAKAIAIISCAAVALLVVVIFGLLGSDVFSGGGSFGAGMLLILLFALGLLVIFVISLFRFNKGMQDGVAHQDPESFEKGISSLKDYFVFIGVFSILIALSYIVKALL
jgi:uncharacterized membrane protein